MATTREVSSKSFFKYFEDNSMQLLESAPFLTYYKCCKCGKERFSQKIWNSDFSNVQIPNVSCFWCLKCNTEWDKLKYDLPPEIQGAILAKIQEKMRKNDSANQDEKSSSGS